MLIREAWTVWSGYLDTTETAWLPVEFGLVWFDVTTTYNPFPVSFPRMQWIFFLEIIM